MSQVSDPGYFPTSVACEKCNRFVKADAVEIITYHAAKGWNGEEIVEGHSSHPECGEKVPVKAVFGRFVRLPIEGGDHA